MTPPGRPVLAERAALGALLLAALLLLAPAIFAGRAVYFRDVSGADVPGLAFIFGSVARGEFPIWNPLSAGGFPVLAAMAPLFYPPQGIFLLAAWGWLGWAACLAVYLALHYWLAGAAAYALGRRWGMAPPAALTAGLAWELSGYLVSLHNTITNLPPAALLPLLVLVYDRLLARPSARRAAAAALLWGLQTACCRPDISLMSVMLLAAYAAWRGWRRPRRLGWVAAALLLGTLLNAVTLLPAVEFLPWSNRAAGIAWSEMSLESVRPLLAITLVLPWFYGRLEDGTDWGRFLVASPDLGYTRYFLTLYGGVVVYALALFARAPRRPGLAPFLAGVWLLAGLLAAGPALPFYGWFAGLPLANLVRFPAKFFLLWAFALAMLAGLGLQALQGRVPARRSRLLAGLLLLAALGLAGVYLGQAALLASLPQVDSGPAGLAEMLRARLPAAVAAGIRQGWAAWALAALALGLTPLAARRPAGRWLLAGLAAADLLVQNAPTILYADPAIYRQEPAVARLVLADPGRPPPRLAWPLGVGQVLRARPELARSNPLSPPQPAEPGARLMMAGLGFNANLLWGVPAAQVYGSLIPYRSPATLLDTLFFPEGGRFAADDPGLARYTRVAGAAHVGYLLVPFLHGPPGPAGEPPPFRGSPDLELVWRHPEGLLLYRNRRLLPRAYLATTAVVAEGDAAAARAVGREARLGQVVILSAGEALAETLRIRAGRGGRAAVSDLRCRVAAYANNRVLVEIATGESGWLVLADNFYPGWQARVDGELRPIVLANAWARAVWVEAGRHQVEFRYRPASFARGLALSLLALLALLALAGRVRRQASSQAATVSSDSSAPAVHAPGR